MKQHIINIILIKIASSILKILVFVTDPTFDGLN